MENPLIQILCVGDIGCYKVPLVNLFLSKVKEAPPNKKININILLKKIYYRY